MISEYHFNEETGIFIIRAERADDCGDYVTVHKLRYDLQVPKAKLDTILRYSSNELAMFSFHDVRTFINCLQSHYNSETKKCDNELQKKKIFFENILGGIKIV